MPLTEQDRDELLDRLHEAVSDMGDAALLCLCERAEELTKATHTYQWDIEWPELEGVTDAQGYNATERIVLGLRIEGETVYLAYAKDAAGNNLSAERFAEAEYQFESLRECGAVSFTEADGATRL